MALTVLLTIALFSYAPSAFAAGRNQRFFFDLSASQCRSPSLVWVVLEPNVTRLQLQLLESSRDFISSHLEFHPSLSRLSSTGHWPCYYQGSVVSTGAHVIASVVDEVFRATFSHNSIVYEASADFSGTAADAEKIPTASASPASNPAGRCGVGRGKIEQHRAVHLAGHLADHLSASAQPQSRQRRSPLMLDTNSPVPPADRKYILLILAADESFYQAMNSSIVKATTRLWDIANYVNGLYKQLGVNVVTVKTDVWTTSQFEVLKSNSSGGGLDQNDFLNKFLSYRTVAYRNVTHTVAHLVTVKRMAMGVTGISPLGKMCLFPASGGLEVDLVINGSSYGVATTVAHELGHNLGMQHDDTGNVTCYCPDPQGCIMQSAVTIADPLRFSDCSVSTFQEFTVPNGLGYCMTRAPDSSQLMTTAPGSASAACGNRMVEPGEDCDCGLPAYCNNSCCNPYTCKFSPGATCASGQCCNTATCSPMSLGSVCRPARGVCDLPEFCNGSSEWCPQFDDYAMDGTTCSTRAGQPTTVEAFCYEGQCSSRDRRCSQLMRGSMRHCPVGNLTTSGPGFCGYSAAPTGSYSMMQCSEQNKDCGSLICQLPSNAPPQSNWMSVGDDQLQMLPPGSLPVPAAIALIDLTLTGYRDPGMVPNGAACGINKMCVNSACLPVPEQAQKAAAACNGHGRIAQSGLCFCDPGFAPPDCTTAGDGGSLMNRPPRLGLLASDRGTAKLSDSFALGGPAFLGVGIAVGIAAALLIGGIVFGVFHLVARRRRHASGGGFNGRWFPVAIGSSAGAAADNAAVGNNLISNSGARTLA